MCLGWIVFCELRTNGNVLVCFMYYLQASVFLTGIVQRLQVFWNLCGFVVSGVFCFVWFAVWHRCRLNCRFSGCWRVDII